MVNPAMQELRKKTIRSQKRFQRDEGAANLVVDCETNRDACIRVTCTIQDLGADDVELMYIGQVDERTFEVRDHYCNV